MARLERVGQDWRLPFAGLVVGLIKVDFAFSLALRDGEGTYRWDARIASPFRFTSADGHSAVVDPEVDKRQLGTVLDLHDQPIEDATVSRGGSLRLLFGDGSVIQVEPSPDYEAWTIAHEGQGPEEMFVCPLAPDEVDWSRMTV